MRPAALALVVAALLGSCEQVSRDRERPAAPFLPEIESSETIEQLLHRGEADRALSILERSLRAKETAPELFHYGRALRLRGRLEEALAAFARANDSDPGHELRRWREMASVQLELGRLADAAISFRAAGAGEQERALLRFLESWEGEAYRASGERQADLAFLGDANAPLPQIECRLEGVGGIPMLLDTGASFCVLSHSLAKRIGLFSKVTGGIQFDLEGKPLAAEFAVLGRLEIGGIRIDSVPVILLDDEALTLRLFGVHPVFRVQGAIGMGVLRRLRTTLDFPNRRASFSQMFPEGSVGIPLSTTGLALHAPMEPELASRTEDGASSRMLFRIDTGSNQSVLTPAAVARWGWESRVRPRVGYFGGAKGWGATLREIETPGLRLGGYRWNSLPLPVAEAAEFPELELGGVLGTDLLKSFRVTIDCHWMTLQIDRTETK